MYPKEYYQLYYKIIFNINKLSNKELYQSLNILRLYSIAMFLKNKFKDKRSINDLYQLLIKEYNL